MNVINPATEEIIASLQEDHFESLQQKFSLLKAAQPAWGMKPLSDRINIMIRFSNLLEENINHLAETLSKEVGKPLQQSKNEIKGARSRIAWLCSNAERYLQDEIMTDESGLTEKISYEPHGVICNISAWNYPYLVGVNIFVPALIAGNSVLYKPSEYSSLSGMEIMKLLYQAGVPENVFSIAIGGAQTGDLLLEIDFDGYYFTGSYKTGQYIYEKVAHKMVPCQLELGGKDPVYIADDIADIQAVAAGVADGAFYNNGQSCCSVERIYVHEKIIDQFIESFVQEVKSFKMGDPLENGVYLGPLTRKAQIELLQAQIEDAVGKGAKILVGGNALKGKGYYFEPTVVVDVHHKMRLMHEESFGPVIGIMKVKDDHEASGYMADTDYGLTAGVYSADRNRAEQILQKLNTGTGYWNCCDRVSAAVPWSGRGHSGFGSTLSHIGLRAFTKPKSYHLRG